MELNRPRPSQPSPRAPEDAPAAGPVREDIAYWEGLEQTEEFRRLISARMRFVLPATAFFLIYYFLLPLANGLAPGFMSGQTSSATSTSPTCSLSLNL